LLSRTFGNNAPQACSPQWFGDQDAANTTGVVSLPTRRAGKITARNRQSRELGGACCSFAQPDPRRPLHRTAKQHQSLNAVSATTPAASFLALKGGVHRSPHVRRRCAFAETCSDVFA